MDYDSEKIDNAVLALLYLNAQSEHDTTRAWKSFDWDAMDRLYEKGYIADPKSTARSVAITPEGLARAQELFEQLYGNTANE